MHKTVKVSTALLVFSLLAIAASAQLSDTRVINSYGTIQRISRLNIEGQWITDGDGNRIQLRAIGCDYTAYNKWDWFETFVGWAKQTGVNAIRLAFCVPGHRVAQTEYDQAKMDKAINYLEANGLYAILDCHHYWTTEEVQGWDDVLPKYKDEWIQTWVDIANRYKDRSVIAVYELVNEPYGSGGAILRNAYYECIDAIRATGDNHIVCASIPERTWIYEADGTASGPATWSNPSQIRENMCLNVHNWHGFDSNDEWFQGSDTSENYIAAEHVASEWIATALYYRDKMDCPVLLGEFGVYNYDMDGADVQSMKLKIEMAEEYGLGWMTWMCEQWHQYAPNFWTTFVNQRMGGSFGSAILSNNIDTSFDLHTFPALPANIWTNINETASTYRIREVGYSRWGVSMIAVPQNYPVAFAGPCTLRVQVWSSGTQPYWGTVVYDYYVTLTDGETWTIGNSENPIQGYTIVYEWEI